METKELLSKLKSLTKTMDIPTFRQDRPHWLSRNMGIRNSEHPNYEEAMEIVKTLVKKGVK